MDTTRTTYYTETTDGSVRPDENQAQRPLTMRELMIQMQQQNEQFIFWQKKQTGHLLTQLNLLRNYARFNRFYVDEQIARLWEGILQHETEEQLKVKGIMKSYPWLKMKEDEDYKRGVFYPLRTPSIASSDTSDEVSMDYVDEADATSVPPQQTAASEANPPPPPRTEAPEASPTASLAGAQENTQKLMLLNLFGHTDDKGGETYG